MSVTQYYNETKIRRHNFIWTSSYSQMSVICMHNYCSLNLQYSIFRGCNILNEQATNEMTMTLKYLIHSTTTSRPYNVLRTMKILGTQWQSKVKKYLPSFTEWEKKNPTSEYFENCFYSPLTYKADCMSLNILLVCYHSNRKQTILKSEYYESKAYFITSCFPLDKKRHSSHTFRLYCISKSNLSCQH